MRIVDNWFRDMPQQFLGKPRIEALVEAFAKQLQELDGVFKDLDSLTDVDTAEGKNLDLVGTIVSLTRKEAGTLAGNTDMDPDLSDDTYRKFLKYKILANTNECTYYDMMNGLEMLWNVSPVYYEEDPDYPATIMLTLPVSEHSGEMVDVGRVPVIKPAGVRVEYEFKVRAAVETRSKVTVTANKSLICGTFVCGTRYLIG